MKKSIYIGGLLCATFMICSFLTVILSAGESYAWFVSSGEAVLTITVDREFAEPVGGAAHFDEVYAEMPPTQAEIIEPDETATETEEDSDGGEPDVGIDDSDIDDDEPGEPDEPDEQPEPDEPDDGDEPSEPDEPDDGDVPPEEPDEPDDGDNGDGILPDEENIIREMVANIIEGIFAGRKETDEDETDEDESGDGDELLMENVYE